MSADKLYSKGPRIERAPAGGDKGEPAGRLDKAAGEAAKSAKKAVPEADMKSDEGPKDDKMDGTDKTMAHDDMKHMHERHHDERRRMHGRHESEMMEMHKAHQKEAKKLSGGEDASAEGPSGGMEDKEVGKGGVEPKA